MRDFAALEAQVALELAGDVDDAGAAVVEGRVEPVPVDPHVVRPRLGDLVARDLLGVVGVGEVDHVDVAGHARRRALGVQVVEARAADLVAHEDVEAPGRAPVREGRVGRPADVGELAHEHRVGGAAAPVAAAHVDDRHAVGPVGGVGDPVHDPDVVDPVAGGVQLETAHPVGAGRVFDVDHVEAHAVVHRVHVVVVDEDVVHAAGEFVVEGGEDLDVARVRAVDDDDAVAPVGGAFARDHADAAVLGDLHVVGGARVHHQGVDHDRGGRVGHVPPVGRAERAPGAGDCVVAAVDAFPHPQVGGGNVLHRALADELHGLAHVARLDADGLVGRVAGHGGHDRVHARPVGHEATLLVDLRRREVRGGFDVRVGHDRIGHRNVARLVARHGRGVEADHVAGAADLLAPRQRN